MNNPVFILLIGLLLGLLFSRAFWEEVKLSRHVGKCWRRWVRNQHAFLEDERKKFERAGEMHAANWRLSTDNMELRRAIKEFKASIANPPATAPVPILPVAHCPSIPTITD